MTTTIEAMKQLQQIIAAVFRDPQNITRDHLEVMKRLVGEAIAAEEAQKVEITEKFKALSENRKEIITGPCGQCKSSKVPCGCQITEGVESYDGIGGTGQDTSRNVDGISKTNLRPISPANTEFLTIKLELMTAERDKLLLELGDLRALRAARPAPPSDHIGDATELVGERAALIEKLKWAAKVGGDAILHVGGADTCKQAADMLAADAQKSEPTEQKLPEFFASYEYAPDFSVLVSVYLRHSDDVPELVHQEPLIAQASEPTQQVAVPQGWRLVPVEPTNEMVSAMWDWGTKKSEWNAILAAAPQPPQADALAADHVEDVRAMVPMTDQELDDLLPTNDSMSRKDSQRWIARATERHHKIGVKP